MKKIGVGVGKASASKNASFMYMDVLYAGFAGAKASGHGTSLRLIPAVLIC